MRRMSGSLRGVAIVLLMILPVESVTDRAMAGASSQEPGDVCLRGVVRTAAGTPLKNMEVRCFHIGASDMPYEHDRQSSDEKGRYEFRVPVGMQYFVETGGKTSTFVYSERYSAERGKDISLADLVVRPFSATVRGRVVREDGRPAANLDYGHVSANCSPIDPLSPPKIGDNGEFAIHLLPDEPFAFWVFVEKNAFHVWKRLDPNSSPLQLILREEACISLPDDWRPVRTHEAIARDMVYAEDSKIDFSLPDLSGKTLSLSDIRAGGKAVVVNITGSWCGGCRLEAPYLVDFYRRYQEKGLEVISIAFERKSNERPLEAVRSFQKEFGINYTLLYGGPTDAAHVQSVIRGLRSFHGYPTTLYLGRDGKVRFIHAGFYAHSETHTKWQLDLMETHIRSILAGQ